MKKYLLLFIVLLTCTMLYGQVVTTIPIDNVKNIDTETLQQSLKSFDLVELHISSLDKHRSASSDQIQSMDIIVESEAFHTAFELYNSAIISPDYKRRTSSGNPMSTPIASAMRGYSTEGYLMSATINENYFHAYIQTAETHYYIEAAHTFDKSIEKNLYVIYDIKDAYEIEEARCQTLKAPENEEEPPIVGKIEAEDCYELDYAVASDYKMYQKYGSVADVENHIIAVTNDVNTNYDDDFIEKLKYVIVETYIVDCSGCDPWDATTDPGDFLNSFTSWGQQGGFESPYTLGTVWTGRTFDGSIVGIAWVDVVCHYYRYNALSDFTSYSEYLRVMASHELGHNWGCLHDAEGSPYIMAPVVSESNDWSQASQDVINGKIPGKIGSGCLHPCAVTGQPPIADFSASANEICEGENIQFTDESQHAESYEWTFEGGTPASSTDPNPYVTYSAAGSYDVTLEVFNSTGSDIITKTHYVEVNPLPIAQFASVVDGLSVEFLNISENGESYIWDFGDGSAGQDENPTHLYSTGGNYEVTLVVKNACGDDSYTMSIYLQDIPVAEFKADHTEGCAPFTVNFTDESTDAENYLWSFEGGVPAASTKPNPSVTYEQPGVYSVELTVTNSSGEDFLMKENYIIVRDVPIAEFMSETDGLEVKFTSTAQDADTYYWDFGDGTTTNQKNPTHTYQTDGIYDVLHKVTNDCGEDTSYGSISVGAFPSAEFTASSTTGCTPLQVTYESTYDGNVTAYHWEFEGGAPATSTDPNPTVTYNSPGTYDVSLQVENGFGMDTVLRKDYILVEQKPASDFSYTTDGLDVQFFQEIQGEYSTLNWDFGDGNTSTEENPLHTYSAFGEYNVVLTSTNACGSTSHDLTVILSQSATAVFKLSETSGCEPFTVQMVNSSSGSDLTFEWFFPGGTPSTSTEKEPTVTYSSVGLYDVTLIAGNAYSQDTAIRKEYVEVLPMPIADFQYELNDLNVQLTQMSEFADLYHWDFGNGETSTESDPEVNYAEYGEYTVRLLVSNQCGEDSISKDLFLTTSLEKPGTADFNVYPNPAHDVLHLSFSESMAGAVKVQLINLSGILVYGEDMVIDGAEERRLELSELPAGMYLVKVQADRGISYKKILKQ